MRGLLFFVCFFVLGVSSMAEAQGVSEERSGCSKGILWPFMRDAGDCLTEREREAGMTGVYGISDPDSDPDPDPDGALPSNVQGASDGNSNRGLLDDNIAAVKFLTNNDTADDAQADEVASDQ